MILSKNILIMSLSNIIIIYPRKFTVKKNPVMYCWAIEKTHLDSHNAEPS